MSSDRLAASLSIDRASADDIVRIINDEDQKVALAVASQRERIARAIEGAVERLRNNGKMFYVGAGTSGRIAMLDASELRPTYGVPDDLVQVIMAGGENAFFHAAEGAEDRDDEGANAISMRVTPDDVVVGIAASGTTPFTVAAVRRANMLGALTIGITSRAPSPLSQEVDIPIVTEVGPEVILGSSRMKSGTAQKMVLNMLSTGVMVQLGRVYSNLMTDMPVTNAKLARRAQQMVELAADVDRNQAQQALAATRNDVKSAVVVAKKKISADEARALLERTKGNLREALES